MKIFELLLQTLCFATASYFYVSPVVSLSQSSLFGKTTRNVATQVLQGTGEPAVDLNKYNLPYAVIKDGLKANFVQKSTEIKGKVRLEAKNNDDHYIDVISIRFPRKRENAGLGIELVEIAGGRSDGVGITIVSGLVPGGSAENSGINPGDSLSSISLLRRKKRITTIGDASKQTSTVLSESEEEYSVSSECLSYERLVEVIGKTIPAPNPDEFEDIYVLCVKRLRRLPKVTIRLQYPPEQNEPDATIEMYAGENLRQGMLVRGVKLNDPLARRFDTKEGGNCGAGGLCRTCSVCVMNGSDVLNPQRVAEKQMMQNTPRWRLACKAVVGYGMKEGEMTVRVNPNQW